MFLHLSRLIGAHKETLASAEIHLLSCDVAIFPANDMKRIHMKMGTFSVCDYTTMEANEPWYFLEMQKDAPSV